MSVANDLHSLLRDGASGCCLYPRGVTLTFNTMLYLWAGMLIWANGVYDGGKVELLLRT